MRCQKENSMITAIWQYRKSSSVQSFLSMSADHRTRSTHLSREKPIVLKKKNRYLIRSGIGLTSRSHVRKAVSRQRWSMPKNRKILRELGASIFVAGTSFAFSTGLILSIILNKIPYINKYIV